MGADLEKFVEMLRGFRNRIRRCDANATETKRTRFLRERTPEIIAVQKSRST
jgi:hypothetical protein